MPTTTPNTPDTNRDSEIPDTAETSGITRLSKTESETEGAHLRRVGEELSGSGEERLARLRSMLSSREPRERVLATEELGNIGSLRAIQVLRELLVSEDEKSWTLAIHGLRQSTSRAGWMCLESVAQDDAKQLASTDDHAVDLSFRRLMAMGRTKMMDRLFRAADGHSRSIPGDIAKQFSENAVATLPELHRRVMELRLGLANGTSATPLDTARVLGLDLDEARSLELQGWQSIHSPMRIDSL
jgi:hypothetical protein